MYHLIHKEIKMMLLKLIFLVLEIRQKEKGVTLLMIPFPSIGAQNQRACFENGLKYP